MSGGITARRPDGQRGRRLHLNHGPIDLIIEAWGEPGEVETAYVQAAQAFDGVLPGLVSELPRLRRPMSEAPDLRGPVARRMAAACRPHLPGFVTPMAAVAGAVADHMLAAMNAGRNLTRAYVNNGGDIAFLLVPGDALDCGIVSDVARPAIDGTVRLTHDMPVRGIATSGRATKGQGGRSFSLGIADSVTVLAANAAAADVAATLIANAVDLPGHPAVERVSARELDPDSDLGDRLVTVGLGPLDDGEIKDALLRGRQVAEGMRQASTIAAAFLTLSGCCATVGDARTLSRTKQNSQHGSRHEALTA
ncbi:MAG: UPF0280 family protein [Kiloniellales bacterium]